MPRSSTPSGPMASEQALIDLWDYIDQVRLGQSEHHAAIIARRALEAARRSTKPTDPVIAAIKNPDYRDLR